MLKRSALVAGLGLATYVGSKELLSPHVQLPDGAASSCAEEIHAAVLACAENPVAFNSSDPVAPVVMELKSCLTQHGVAQSMFSCSKPVPYTFARFYVGGIKNP